MASRRLREDREKLEKYYEEVKTIILSRQNPATGLIPASVAVTNHGDYRDAWVRDNVYSILAVWGLGLAYRRLDDDEGRAYELEHATIKCMRGLLYAMMQQAPKVEKFKNTQSLGDALHAKYNTTTGATVVKDHEWGHLQLDATSIFLLMLAQMTVSGLHIVYTLDEVDFIQNLTFYIERAYRTPDYGVWERGNKINHGQPELNCSSIGMAVAALQAINGINLFGSRGGPRSVIHVLPDEITRNFTTLHSALPRESASKEIDAALLSVISFPAFAVADPDLIDRTRNEIWKKLGGRYGCKRFLRDGHQTVLEDSSRLHYEPHELKIFEGVESEWPLFFTYFILDGLFRDDDIQVEQYRGLIEPLLVDSCTIPLYNREKLLESEEPGWQKRSRKMSIHRELPPENMRLVPELYIVPMELVEAERKKRSSQDRVPNANIPLVWAQSLYILGNLMYDKLLSPADVDPLGRRLLPYSPSNHMDPVVQVCLLAESAELQSKLLMFGLETQTRENCAPITISQPSSLRDAFRLLGENEKLGLSGRPSRPIGTLSTCKIYRCQGSLYAFLPHFMDREEFYLVSDNDYLVTLFEQELAFVKNHWFSSGRPTMVVMLTHQMLGELGKKQASAAEKGDSRWRFNVSNSRRNLLNFMMSLRTGMCNGVRVRLGRLSEMVSTSCIESLDFLVRSDNAAKEDWEAILSRNEPEYTERRLHFSESTTNKAASIRSASTNTSLPGRHTIKMYSVHDDVRSQFDAMKSPLSTPVFSEDYTDDDFKLTSPAEHLVLIDSIRSDSKSPGPDRRTASPSRVSRVVPPAALDTKLATHAIHANIKNPSTLSQPVDPVSNTTASPEEDDLLTLTLGDDSNLEAAIELLRNSENLYDQVDILHYIMASRSIKYVIPDVGQVEVLLEEVYVKAMHLKQWSIVRQAAGLLKKSVNSLTSNLSDLLIRQKPVTIGFGSQEFFIDSPMNPKALSEIIFKHCASDVREAPLVQEVITYLGSAIRSNSSLFNGIMRIRTHFFIIAMREEISRLKGCDEEEAIEHLMQLSPFEMKSLLNQVLRAGEQVDIGLDSSAQTPRIMNLRHIRLEETSSLKEASSFPTHLPDSITISAQSGGFEAGNFAKIQVHHDQHEHEVPGIFGRGLNVVIIDHMEGRILETNHYDTNISKEESEEFAKRVAKLEPKTIVVITTKDDCAAHLTESAMVALERLGSQQARELRYRDSFCLIGEKGTLPGSAVEHRQPSQLGPTPVISRKIDLLAQRREFLSSATGSTAISLASIMPTHGRWLRRRKNDGALNRTPPEFYPKVWRLLSKVVGITIGKRYLPRDPTISEKTPEEFNFALQVEALLDAIRDPAERQIAVETLVVIARIEDRNPEIKLRGEKLEISKIIKAAVSEFWMRWIAAQRGASSAAAPIAAKATKPDSTSAARAGKHVVPSIKSSTTIFSALQNMKLEATNEQSGSSSALLANLEREGLENEAVLSTTPDYSFENNQRLARRLFFDLTQDGEEGTMAYLAEACVRTVFTVNWQ